MSPFQRPQCLPQQSECKLIVTTYMLIHDTREQLWCSLFVMRTIADVLHGSCVLRNYRCPLLSAYICPMMHFLLELPWKPFIAYKHTTTKASINLNQQGIENTHKIHLYLLRVPSRVMVNIYTLPAISSCDSLSSIKFHKDDKMSSRKPLDAN